MTFSWLVPTCPVHDLAIRRLVRRTVPSSSVSKLELNLATKGITCAAKHSHNLVTAPHTLHSWLSPLQCRCWWPLLLLPCKLVVSQISFKRAAFYQSLKSKVSLAATKAGETPLESSDNSFDRLVTSYISAKHPRSETRAPKTRLRSPARKQTG